VGGTHARNRVDAAGEKRSSSSVKKQERDLNFNGDGGKKGGHAGLHKRTALVAQKESNSKGAASQPKKEGKAIWATKEN